MTTKIRSTFITLNWKWNIRFLPRIYIRLVHESSDILEPFFAVLFVWSLVTICGSLLMVQLEMVLCIIFFVTFLRLFISFHFWNIIFLQFQLHHGDSLMAVLIIAFQVFYGFGAMFTTCELSQRINLAFDECNDIIVQFDWFLLPVKIQRMLPAIMHFAQQPVNINCFGSSACDRALFKSVGLTFQIYLYFTMLSSNLKKTMQFSQVTKTAFSYFMVVRKFFSWIQKHDTKCVIHEILRSQEKVATKLIFGFTEIFHFM